MPDLPASPENPAEAGEVTGLLGARLEGDRAAADRIFAILHEELRRSAHFALADQLGTKPASPDAKNATRTIRHRASAVILGARLARVERRQKPGSSRRRCRLPRHREQLPASCLTLGAKSIPSPEIHR